MRKSGILAHPTSFPSKYGIGDLGKGAYEFVDFLEKSGQKLWQILPLGQTSFGDSPYQSFSVFAGNIYIISPDILVKKGYLSKKDIEVVPEFDEKNVEAVKDAIKIDDGFYGKTGTGMINGKEINGWFVGFVEQADNVYFFATNINGYDNAFGSTAADITIEILGDRGIINYEN